MKPSILILLITITATGTGCTTFPVDTIESNQYLGYKPIDPLPVATVERYDNGKMVDVYWASITQAEDRRALLPLQSAQVAVSKTSSSGKISYLGGFVSGDGGSYEVVMDYMKYRVEDILDNSDKYVGSVRIGVGLRIRAQVVTNKSNINLGSIANLGLEASNENLRGGISVDVIGIDSKDVTNLIPLTSDINQTSIQSALQALASIKSKLWDDIEITPHVIAIKQAESGTESKIRSSISTFGKDVYSIKIRNFWKPDGTNIDKKNETTLKTWMFNNGLAISAGSITTFISTKQFSLLRKKAVFDLQIGEK